MHLLALTIFQVNINRENILYLKFKRIDIKNIIFSYIKIRDNESPINLLSPTTPICASLQQTGVSCFLTMTGRCQTDPRCPGDLELKYQLKRLIGSRRFFLSLQIVSPSLGILGYQHPLDSLQTLMPFFGEHLVKRSITSKKLLSIHLHKIIIKNETTIKKKKISIINELYIIYPSYISKVILYKN